ncbi:hypothetical protein BJY00DRAFT_309677 [Aspergillus carlsbadensis]|nr:hypothetical protein BJY00DRAFT_309677 [Aspergillus carlsbadensis]
MARLPTGTLISSSPPLHPLSRGPINHKLLNLHLGHQPAQHNDLPTNSRPRCPLTSTGHEEFLAKTNIISLNIEILAPLIHAAVSNNTMSGDSFNASVMGSVEMQYNLAPGQAGYLNAAVKGRCYSKTVGIAPVEDGNGVEICAPIWTFNGTNVRFSADWTAQNASVQDLKRYSDLY